MRGRVLFLLVAAFALSPGRGEAQQAKQESSNPAAAGLDRTTLPIAEPKPATYKELDARNAKPPARFEVKPPQGAPNVVIVLIDDIGFGGPDTFSHADDGPARPDWPAFQQLPHDGVVIAHA